MFLREVIPLTNEKILKMLNLGETDELKKLLQNEIYIKELNRKNGADKRYKAMINYFNLSVLNKPVCQFPYRKDIKGITYSCFMDGYSAVLSKEDLGNMELYDEKKYNAPYADIEKIFEPNSEIIFENFNMSKVFAAAKSLGYKLNKSSLSGNKALIFELEGIYFNIGLLDKAFRIIDNGEKVNILREKRTYSPIIVENDIGKCLVLPIRPDANSLKEHTIIHFNDLI